MVAPVPVCKRLPFWLGWTALVSGTETLRLWDLRRSGLPGARPQPLWSGGHEPPPELGEPLQTGFLSPAGRETSRAVSGASFLCAASARWRAGVQVGWEGTLKSGVL